ncbi:glycoside hydrolase [Hymenopellis radicata]|nr:glycoside hydrolase [Hymenopellis radicata]
MFSGAWDKAYEWTALTADERTAIKAEYDAAGIKLMVSVFGATDVPTTSGADPVSTAQTMAAWVKEYDLDGIDVDYEDFSAFSAGTAELPQGEYIITHAPVAPWFTPTLYTGGGYLKVEEAVGSMIDWYNIQFYNQGTSEYTTCDGLLTASSSTWPETALFQIIANGVDGSKLVVGKPATTSDANNGYMEPSLLASCLATAKDQGWDGGAMVWQFPNADESWIKTVRSLSWPV